MESADTDFLNDLFYDHYNNEVQNLDEYKTLTDHLNNIGMENEE
jgi:hypothetical protein